MKKIITFLMLVMLIANMCSCGSLPFSKSKTEEKPITTDKKIEKVDSKSENDKNDEEEKPDEETADVQADSEGESDKTETTEDKSDKEGEKETSEQDVTQTTPQQPLIVTPATPSVTYVKTISESSAETAPYKYGVNKTITTTKYYDIYSDGTKILRSENKKETYDYSNYGATDSELMSEANSKASSNMAYYNEVLALVNQIRAQVGAAPLVLDTTLCKAATMRAVEMNYSGVFSHTRPNNSSCFTVYNTYGISYMATGENIAAGQRTPAQVVESWKNSPGHYRNMINPDYGKMGVGMSNERIGYGIYWAQLFTN